LPSKKDLPYSRRVDWWLYSGAALTGYLLGSIPTGYLVAKARGVDIRSVGSGNIGATNVFRVLGKPAGAFVLLMDALKGALGCWLPRVALPKLLSADGPQNPELVALAGGFAAILGHNYTCWLRFKGGKGIATSAGVLLVLMPGAFGLCLGLWLLLLAATRYVSVASIAAALALPFVVWALRGSQALVIVAAVVGSLALYKHRTNLQRLLAGSEQRLGKPPGNHSQPIDQ
jgi:glycerol-3-phosphate acyltransferase PlsY